MESEEGPCDVYRLRRGARKGLLENVINRGTHFLDEFRTDAPPLRLVELDCFAQLQLGFRMCMAANVPGLAKPSVEWIFPKGEGPQVPTR